MKNSSDSLQLLALVPHRDVRVSLRAWSASLFSAGMSGAWSFPWIMPIAALKRPLSTAELKSRALMLRRETDLAGGKFITGPSAITVISDNVSVFGPAVDIGLSDGFFDFGDAVIRRISPLVIGAALCPGSSSGINFPAPSLSFRAAALANMCLRPMSLRNGDSDDFSFEWETGKLYWLPKN